MVRPPRGSTRSAKYIIDVASSSESSGLQAQTVINAQDGETLGQTSGTSALVPTGSKVMLLDLRMPKVNLSATANFVHWSIQRTQSGQSVINPISMGGNPLRKNVLLSGIIGLGDSQNNGLHIRYKIPKKFQRMGDGDVWSIVNNNTSAVSTVYQFMYKVFQ